MKKREGFGIKMQNEKEKCKIIVDFFYQITYNKRMKNKMAKAIEKWRQDSCLR